MKEQGMIIKQFLAPFRAGVLIFIERFNIQFDRRSRYRVVQLLMAMLISCFSFAQPNWQIDAGSYQYSMTVTSLLEMDGDTLRSADDMVAAFVNGEARGVASPVVFIASTGQYLAFLTVLSNTVSGEEITFKTYNASKDRIAECQNTIAFTDGNQLGSNTDPEVLSNLIIWDGAVWSTGAAPNTEQSARLLADYSIASHGNLELQYLQVSENKTVTIESGESVQVVNLDNFGTVKVQSGGSLVTIRAVSGEGFVIERITTFDQSTGRYSIVGSPVKNAEFDVLGAGAVVYSYDESAPYHPTGNQGLNRFKTPDQLVLTTLEAGKGYFSAFTGDETGKVVFQGAINAGNIDVSLRYTSHGDAAEADFQGFNLVSNPYPAAIDFQQFIAGNSGNDIDETIYLWDDHQSETERGSNQDYLVVNATLGNTDSRSGGASSWDGYIRSGQGFFVKANSSSTLQFTDDMKVSTNNSDGGYFRLANVEKYKIRLSGGGQSKATIIGFLEDATTGKDAAYDATMLSVADFSICTQSVTGQNMAIQALPKDFENPVPLRVSVPEDGTYTIDLMNEKQVGEPIWIYDQQTGLYHDLTKSSFDFSTSETGTVERFELRRVNEILASDDTPLWNLYISEKTLHVKMRGTETAELRVYSLSGKQVFTGNTRNDQQIDLSHLEEGVYVVRFGETVQKVVVR